MTRPTPTQLVALLGLIASSVLAGLQSVHELHTPAWVYAVLAGVVSVCHSVAPVVTARMDGTVTVPKAKVDT